MKRKFHQIAKKLNCQIQNYRSYRSDMGWQVFDMLVIAPNGNRSSIDAAYIVGDPNDRSKLLPSFEEELIKLCKKGL